MKIRGFKKIRKKKRGEIREWDEERVPSYCRFYYDFCPNGRDEEGRGRSILHINYVPLDVDSPRIWMCLGVSSVSLLDLDDVNVMFNETTNLILGGPLTSKKKTNLSIQSMTHEIIFVYMSDCHENINANGVCSYGSIGPVSWTLDIYIPPFRRWLFAVRIVTNSFQTCMFSISILAAPCGYDFDCTTPQGQSKLCADISILSNSEEAKYSLAQPKTRTTTTTTNHEIVTSTSVLGNPQNETATIELHRTVKNIYNDVKNFFTYVAQFCAITYVPLKFVKTSKERQRKEGRGSIEEEATIYRCFFFQARDE